MRNSLRSLVVGLLSNIIVLSSLDRLLAEDPAASKPSVSDGAEKQNIETAFKMTREAAQKYEFAIRGVDQPAVLREQPILRWSNPERGQVYGHVFLWTYRGRPGELRHHALPRSRRSQGPLHKFSIRSTLTSAAGERQIRIEYDIHES